MDRDSRQEFFERRLRPEGSQEDRAAQRGKDLRGDATREEDPAGRAVLEGEIPRF
jgi:hypothetical protein